MKTLALYFTILTCFLAAGCGSGSSTSSDLPPASSAYIAQQPASPGYISTPAAPVRVIDGDTAVFSVNHPVVHNETVRFLGIDTPETGQCYSDIATAYTSSFVMAEPLRLVCESDGPDYHLDIYGRALCYVYSADMTRSLNEELLRGGYAMGYFVFRFEFHDQYLAIESKAIQTGAGLWSSCQPK